MLKVDDRMYGVWVEIKRSDSVYVVLFMLSMGSVFLAAYARWEGGMFS